PPTAVGADRTGRQFRRYFLEQGNNLRGEPAPSITEMCASFRSAWSSEPKNLCWVQGCREVKYVLCRPQRLFEVRDLSGLGSSANHADDLRGSPVRLRARTEEAGRLPPDIIVRGRHHWT